MKNDGLVKEFVPYFASSKLERSEAGNDVNEMTNAQTPKDFP